MQGQTPTQSTHIQTSLDAQAYATHTSSSIAGAPTGQELIWAVTPALSVSSRGSAVQLDGQWQFQALSYAHGTQPDRILPSGNLNARVLGDRGLPGLDLSVMAAQVLPSVTDIQSVTPSTQNSYTNTTYRISPFIERDLDDTNHLSARIDRSQLVTSQVVPGLSARPDMRMDNDLFQLSGRPVPLGYALSWQRQYTKTAIQDEPILDERLGKATGLYALTRELQVGLSIGRSYDRVGPETFSDTLHGVQAEWHPTERTSLKSEVDDRYFGRGWSGTFSHKTPWWTLSFQTDRDASTYASAIGNINATNSLRSLYDALLSTRITNPVDRSQAVDELIARRDLASQISPGGDVYDLAAQLSLANTASLAFMGKRDILTLVAGLVRTDPLPVPGAVAATSLSGAFSTHQTFVDVQLNHQLTPESTVSTGMRWSRVRSTTLSVDQVILARDWTWKASFNTLLTPDTTATMGFSRQLTHTPSPFFSDVAALFVGLGHRF
jgi:uncharacterized protein (PEP-CTERM system associated)